MAPWGKNVIDSDPLHRRAAPAPVPVAAPTPAVRPSQSPATLIRDRTNESGSRGATIKRDQRDKRRTRDKKRRRRSRLRVSSFLDAPFTAMVPTPSRREVRKIKKGKYARFDKLFSPVDDLLTVAGGKQQKKKNTRQVCDLGSWLEAWNIFIALRVQIAPATALELVKYQSIVCQLFAIHSAAAALKYDKLFRQAAARDRQQSLR